MGNAVVHFEVIGSDGPALEKFYGELFGWHIQSMPEMSYGIVDVHAGAGINGGIGTTQDGTKRVTVYAEVDDPASTLDRAAALGGRVVMPVMEIPGAVTLAQFADPDGNVIGLVKSEPGSDQMAVSPGTNPPVDWFEIMGKDAGRLKTFYSSLFGWHITEGEYGEVDTHAGRGINGGVGGGVDATPNVTVYARVDDPAKYLERAEALGGATAMAPTKVGENLTVATFTDPQGNIFGLYRYES